MTDAARTAIDAANAATAAAKAATEAAQLVIQTAKNATTASISADKVGAPKAPAQSPKLGK
jgi:hypothetical protein